MFKPISCVQTNVQPGFRRFPNARDQPLIKPWRCELTALSHTFNLYFIACNDTVHIYRPNFPNQGLPGEPDLILHPPVSSPYLHFAVDPEHPHSITRLHVDYLGREEILLVACDDGDVIGYRVPELHRAIESRKDEEEEEDETDLEDQIRVFLHRNVGASAWGLAVHREARLIAISANTHQVTVLAYALSSPSSDSDSSQNPDSFSSDEEEEDFPYPRQRDHVFTLQVMTNTPAISFDNRGDPEGRWLFSSSIDGANHIWDLHAPQEKTMRVIDLGFCVSVENPSKVPSPCRCPGRTSVPHAAWGAMFIDPRSCHRTSSVREACGPGIGPEGPRKITPCFWDITETVPRFRARRGGPFPSTFGLVNSLNTDGESDEDGDSDSDSDEESENDGTAEEDGEEDEEAEAEAEAEEEDEGEVNENIDGNGAGNENEEEHEGGVDNASVISGSLSPTNGTDPSSQHEPTNPPNAIPPPQAWLSLFIPETMTPIPISAQTSPTIDDDDDAMSDFSDGSPNFNFQDPPSPVRLSPVRLSPKIPYCSLCTQSHFQNDPYKDQPKPCIVVTKEEIYLFQRPLDPAGDFKDPILTMRNPLFPYLHDGETGWYPTPSHHRQCYVQQIPELGVFIVASPAGRVGIFSLTVTKESGDRGKRMEKDVYAFRMDHLLPNSKNSDGKLVIEEVWGRRLVGVAVGPVQGMLNKRGDEEDEDEEGGEMGTGIGSRRWRLLIYYHDHTVYSYELGKEGDGGGIGVGVCGLGDLVV